MLNGLPIHFLPSHVDSSPYPKGIMRGLLYALKESKNELCDGQRFLIDQNMSRQDMLLPLFNRYYKQSSPPKTRTHSEGLENSLNKNKEFTQRMVAICSISNRGKS
jgi:hypothetical protein